MKPGFGGWLRALLVALLAAAALPARAVPTCTVSSDARLAFGTVVALASTGDRSTNTGSSFWVNCSAEVTAAPSLHSSSTRTMVSGGNGLPFSLSLVAPGGADLPTSSPGASLSITRNGTNQTVTLYGKILASAFRSLPAGTYSTVVSVTIVYN
jgi:spore coat protein U-like protein